MWRLLQNPIPEALRAELEARIGSALAGMRGAKNREADLELDGFFAASRGAGALLRQLIELPDARALIGERLRDPVVVKACPTIKPSGAPATHYGADNTVWPSEGDEPALFTLWHAITDATVGNGCLRMAASTGEGERTMVARHSSLELSGTSAPSYDVAMKPGQVVFFDSDQIHGAYPNHSDRARIAVRIVLGERGAVEARDARAIDDYGSVGLVVRQTWRKLFGGAK